MSYTLLSGVKYQLKVDNDTFTFTNNDLSLTKMVFLKRSIPASTGRFCNFWYMAELEVDMRAIPCSHILSALEFLKKTYNNDIMLSNNEDRPCTFDLDF
jgi:hypothetical protein